MKRFWTYIKHKRADNNTIPPLKSDRVLHPDPVDNADILNKQFQLAFSSKSEITKEVFKSSYNMRGNFGTMQEINITEQGITKLLKNLNPNKVPGPDNIIPRILKEMTTHISPILAIIFRESYDTAKVSNIRKTAFVCPIYKKGKEFEAINTVQCR